MTFIVLIVINLLVHTFKWYTPSLKYGLIDFIQQLYDKNDIVLILLVIIPIISLAVKKIAFKNSKLEFTKIFVLISIPLFLITLISPVYYSIRNKKKKIYSAERFINNTITYATNSVEIYLESQAVIEFCNKKATEHPHLNTVKILKDYIESSDSSLHIKNQVVFRTDSFVIYENYENVNQIDTIRLIDKTNVNNTYIEVIDWAVTELIESGQFNIYDLEEKKFVEYIYYRTVSDPLGNLDLICSLPNGRKFIDKRLLWGL